MLLEEPQALNHNPLKNHSFLGQWATCFYRAGLTKCTAAMYRLEQWHTEPIVRVTYVQNRFWVVSQPQSGVCDVSSKLKHTFKIVRPYSTRFEFCLSESTQRIKHWPLEEGLRDPRTSRTAKKKSVLQRVLASTRVCHFR